MSPPGRKHAGLARLQGGGMWLSLPRAFTPWGLPRASQADLWASIRGPGVWGPQERDQGFAPCLSSAAPKPSSGQDGLGVPLVCCKLHGSWSGSCPQQLAQGGSGPHSSEGRSGPDPLSGFLEGPQLRWEGRGCGRSGVGWHQAQHSRAAPGPRRLRHPACVLIPRGPRDAAASQPTHPPLMRRVWASSELGSHSTNPRIFLTPEGPYLSPATPSSRALPQPAASARVRCAWTGRPRRGGRSRQSSRVHPTRRLQGSSLRGPVSHACPDEAVAPAVWWGCTVARCRRGDLGLRRLVAHCT